jgi:hypothetical protein
MKKLTSMRPPRGWAEFDRSSEERIKELEPDLLPEHKGKIIVVEPESGDYFIGETLREANRAARKRHPDKVFFADRLGGGGVIRPHPAMLSARGHYYY